jgi:hypothetical protein
MLYEFVGMAAGAGGGVQAGIVDNVQFDRTFCPFV